jgi:pilus assembly protein TadC
MKHLAGKLTTNTVKFSLLDFSRNVGSGYAAFSLPVKKPFLNLPLSSLVALPVAMPALVLGLYMPTIGSNLARKKSVSSCTY